MPSLCRCSGKQQLENAAHSSRCFSSSFLRLKKMLRIPLAVLVLHFLDSRKCCAFSFVNRNIEAPLLYFYYILILCLFSIFFLIFFNFLYFFRSVSNGTRYFSLCAVICNCVASAIGGDLDGTGGCGRMNLTADRLQTCDGLR